MEPSHRPPVTDSPWFWVLIFSLVALGALVSISGKYGPRQTVIERQYQARERIAEPREAGSARRNYASHDENLIPLWPLAVLLIAIALFAWAMLCRGRADTAGRRPPPGSRVEPIL